MQYLLVRPHPSLRILFASPDLRVAGILQAPLLSQIGGSQRVREDLEHALEVGRKVTARVQWISKPAQNIRSRWIHCTPLLGVNGLIAVWMVILVDDIEEEEKSQAQLPVKPLASNETPTSPAEVLPWEAIGNPGYSGILSRGFVEGSGSSNTSQAALSGDGNMTPFDSTPPVPERNRLRKGRPSNLPADPSRDAMMGATISPFASKTDTRYKVKVWSGPEEQQPKQSMDENSRPRAPRLRFGQHPDLVGKSDSPPFTVRPGPRINGKAYSFDSNSEHGISVNDESGSDGRPMSRSSRGSSFAPAGRDNGQPVVAPIHLPSRPEAQNGAESRPLTRRTYKSLSPYGVLFDS